MKKYEVSFGHRGCFSQRRGFVWVDNGVIVRIERHETVSERTEFNKSFVGRNFTSLPNYYKCVEVVESSAIGDAITRLSSHRDRVLEDCKRISEEMAMRATYDSFMSLHLLQGKINGLDVAINTLKYFEGKEQHAEMPSM